MCYFTQPISPLFRKSPTGKLRVRRSLPLPSTFQLFAGCSAAFRSELELLSLSGEGVTVSERIFCVVVMPANVEQSSRRLDSLPLVEV